MLLKGTSFLCFNEDSGALYVLIYQFSFKIRDCSSYNGLPTFVNAIECSVIVHLDNPQECLYFYLKM